MIRLNNINVFFNRNTKLEKHVLKDLNLTIESGEFITIIGGNGAGKSTLMNVLSGNLTPDSGNVFIDDQDITKLPLKQRSKLVARVFQDPIVGTYGNLTIEENMSIADKRGADRNFSTALTQSSRQKYSNILSNLAMNLENCLKTQVSDLSGGQRQALSLVMATLQQSKILLLDEHTSALDPKMADVIMNITADIVKEQQLTTLMITHSMTQALKYGNRTIMLYHGEIIRDMKYDDRKALSSEDLIKYFDL